MGADCSAEPFASDYLRRRRHTKPNKQEPPADKTFRPHSKFVLRERAGVVRELAGVVRERAGVVREFARVVRGVPCVVWRRFLVVCLHVPEEGRPNKKLGH